MFPLLIFFDNDNNKNLAFLEHIFDHLRSALVLLFVAYGVAVLPFTYLLSFLFSGTTAGYVVVAALNAITGTCVT